MKESTDPKPVGRCTAEKPFACLTQDNQEPACGDTKPVMYGYCNEQDTNDCAADTCVDFNAMKCPSETPFTCINTYPEGPFCSDEMPLYNGYCSGATNNTVACEAEECVDWFEEDEEGEIEDLSKLLKLNLRIESIISNFQKRAKNFHQ